MTDRALNYLGLMRRAGRLEIGETATGYAIKEGRARCVCVAADAADNAVKRAKGWLQGRRALYVELPYTKEQLSDALGRSGCSMVACTDFGLAGAFLAALAEKDAERYGALAEEMRRRSDKAAYRKARGPKRKPGRELNE